MKLNPKALGLALGIIWGLAVLITTWIIMFQDGGATLSKLGKLYLGYRVSFLGSIIGLIYGFIDGLIAGFLIAWLYNIFAKEK